MDVAALLKDRRYLTMTQEERLALIRQIRSSKYLTKPATVKRQRKSRNAALQSLLKRMSPEQVRAILAERKEP